MGTITEEAELHHTYWARRARSQIMPVIPTGTKKTLQELSRVFSKLAIELSRVRNEIENLRKEIHRLKSSPASQRTSHSSKSSKGSGKTTVRPRGQRNSSTSHEKKNQGPALPKSDSEYIFPREPFNPPTPSEPSPPSNN